MRQDAQGFGGLELPQAPRVKPLYQQDVLWRCEASRMIDSSVLAGCG
ncbi:hypothetical protein FOFC_14732 [Fusarium oxysporum]|nr:hypothetical protein FOFC_14732 [Fusarium oxysporum]